MSDRPKIAVVIPCYRVRDKIVSVVDSVIGTVDFVIAVDDCCPEKSGDFLGKSKTDLKLKILFHEKNQGVGGAMVTGFQAALDLGADVVVKMDGDGQMEAKHLPRLVGPLLSRKADFTKGNRFYDLRALRAMPVVRRIGNFGLTLLSKAASGFWHLSDPTNGYFALRANALRLLNFHLLAPRYFFEISLLIQLNVIRAIAFDVPIPAKYADENSSLSPMRALWSFPGKLAAGLMHRIWWRYFIYDINIVTVFLMTGALLFFGGGIFGAWRWSHNWIYGHEQSAGTVALAMLPMILGFQMLLQAVVLDMMDKPDAPISDVMEMGGVDGETSTEGTSNIQ
jgi:glycosyltransferase involved in cell wall biosynthesis